MQHLPFHGENNQHYIMENQTNTQDQRELQKSNEKYSICHQLHQMRPSIRWSIRKYFKCKTQRPPSRYSTRKSFKPVSRHFTSSNHTSDDITATIVTQKHNVNFRLHTEETWINILQMKGPCVLNLIL